MNAYEVTLERIIQAVIQVDGISEDDAIQKAIIEANSHPFEAGEWEVSGDTELVDVYLRSRLIMEEQP